MYDVSVMWTDHCVRQCPLFAGEICKCSLIPMIRPTVHTNPPRKRSFMTTLFKPEELKNAGFALSVWTNNIFKVKLFENNEVTIIT